MQELSRMSQMRRNAHYALFTYSSLIYIPLQLSLAVIYMSYTANEGWMAENADGTVTFLY